VGGDLLRVQAGLSEVVSRLDKGQHRAVSVGPRVLFALLVTACSGQSVLAQATTVDQIFPLGVQAGTTTTLRPSGKVEGQTIVWWSNSPALTFAPGEKPNEIKVTAAAGAIPGLRLMRATGPEGAGKLLPLVVGTVPEIEEVEPNNKPTEATPVPEPLAISAGVTLNGSLGKRGDVDHVAVKLEAGQTLVAALDGHRLLDSPMDSLLQMLSPRGHVLLQNHDDRGLDPLLVYTAVESGLHFVRIMAYPSQPDTSVALSGGPNYLYRLTLSTGPVVSHRLPVPHGREARSGLLVGWNLSAEQQHVALPPAGDAEVSLPLLEIVGFQKFPIDAALAASLVEGEPPLMAVLETLPVAVSGTIATANERDEFRVHAAKGATVRLRVRARELDSQLDPVLVVLDAKGAVVKEVDDNGQEDHDIDTTVVAPDGPLTVRVFDRFDRGSFRHFYLVDVRNDEPDFTLTVPSAALTVKPGEKVEIKVAVNRRGGLNKSISISAEDLPEGVTAMAQTSAEKGDSSKEVTLVLQAAADAMPGGQAIRIVGKSEGDTPIVRTATLPRVGLVTNLTALWLTVIK
jgi:hypothetical protein